MGWKVAEGSRFSGSTPPPPRPSAIRPRKRGYLNSLAGLFWCRGGGVESTSRRHAATAGGNSGACSAPYGFQFTDGRRAWHQGEQETLAAIIEHRRAGLSWAKVADKLSATGHRTRTGGQWTRQGAHQVHQARERARRRSVNGARRAGARPGARKPGAGPRVGGLRRIDIPMRAGCMTMRRSPRPSV